MRDRRDRARPLFCAVGWHARVNLANSGIDHARPARATFLGRLEQRRAQQRRRGPGPGRPERAQVRLEILVNRLIAFSGDTEWTDTLVEVARDADLYITECHSYDKPIRNHLNYKIIEQNLPRLAAKKIVLTHMSDDMLAWRHKVAQLAARDGMVVKL